VGDDGCPSMEFRHCSQVDGEGEHDLLPFAQSEVGSLDEDTRGAQIDGLAQLPAATRNSDVDNGPSSVPRMQAAFHLNQPRVVLLIVRRDQGHYAVVRPDAMDRFNLMSQ
jgi:hypothetical protein